MAVKDYLKVSRKTFFNPRAWLNYDEFKNQTGLLWGILKPIITLPTPAPISEETFEQAMIRHEMTEADRVLAIQAYRRFALLFVFLGALAFIYAFFLLFAYHVFSGWLLAMCVCALLLSQAFKYDFWSLQLRRRNLRITYRDWLDALLGKNGGAV